MAEAVTGGRARRTLRRMAWGTLAMILTSPLWCNLLLATPLATTPLERLIRRHSGLDCELKRLSAWPGHGFGVHQLRILTPRHRDEFAGLCLLEVESIRVQPRWGALLEGKLEWDSVTLCEPRLMLPVEVLMAAIPRTMAAADPPALVLNGSPPSQSLPGPAVSPPVGTLPDPSGNARHADGGGTAPGTEEENPPPTRGAVPPPTRGAVPPPTQWCHIENASLKLYSLQHPGFDLRLRDFGGSLPIGGKPAKSTVTVGRLSHLQLDLLERSRLALEWDGDALRLEAPEINLGGLETRLRARCKLRAGLPFHILSFSPMQEFDGQWQGPAQLHARAARLGVRAELGGYLQSPASWQGLLLAAVGQARLKLSAHRAQFESGSLQAHLFPGGRLHCAEAILRDDEATLMARGDLWSDGRFAVNLRLVTDPAQAAGIAQTLFPELDPHSGITPLSTPQRCAFDLEASGRPGQIAVKVGHHESVLKDPADPDPHSP